MLTTNGLHNILNIVIWALGLLAVVATYAGCSTFADGSIDCSASTIIPPSWLPVIITITTAAGGLKTIINIFRDGIGGLFKTQPPVK